MSESEALLQLLVMLATDWRTGGLMALLAVAAVIDWRTLRIPNWLTVGGMLLGLAGNAVFPAPAQGGVLWALAGLATGIAVLLPLYMVRVLGAGDVKLMGAVGAFVGLSATLQAVLFTFIVGGIAALAFALAHRATRRMAHNIAEVAQSAAFAALSGMTPRFTPTQSIGRLPYGVSIAVGTTACLCARQLGLA